MIFPARLLIITILLIGAACQTTLGGLETATLLPSPSPQPERTLRPTQTPRFIATQVLSPTPLPSPTSTALPTVFFQPTVAPETSIAAFQAPVSANRFVVGQSVEGRSIVAYRFGTGARVLLLVGGIHGGFEANTVTLLQELVEHFERAPGDVLPGITLILIPAANPDGLTRGREAAGRFNANEVDLNRNWGCEWSEAAVWRDNQVDPGARPFSEPETLALAQYIRQTQPAAVVFYHSAARGVFAGNCETDHGSAALAAVLGEAANYPYGETFSAYPVSGTAATWVDGQGIPAVDLELTTTESSEFVRNLNGVMAVQCWLVEGEEC